MRDANGKPVLNEGQRTSNSLLPLIVYQCSIFFTCIQHTQSLILCPISLTLVGVFLLSATQYWISRIDQAAVQCRGPSSVFPAGAVCPALQREHRGPAALPPVCRLYASVEWHLVSQCTKSCPCQRACPLYTWPSTQTVRDIPHFLI